MIKGELKNAVACERSGQGILSEASFTSSVVSAHPLWGPGHIETTELYELFSASVVIHWDSFICNNYIITKIFLLLTKEEKSTIL